jgi:hypothetical protein
MLTTLSQADIRRNKAIASEWSLFKLLMLQQILQSNSNTRNASTALRIVRQFYPQFLDEGHSVCVTTQNGF